MTPDELKAVIVIGAGQMGAGIAQVCAQAGLSVMLSDVELERSQAGKRTIELALTRLVDKGRMPAAERDALLGRIAPSAGLDAAGAADLAIEAASENPELKQQLFRELDSRLRPEALLLSNTSSISITRLSAQTSRPDRVAGMHFMNPVPLMKLVEVVSGVQTSLATQGLVCALAARLGKTVIKSQDRPGFIVNRILIPLLNEACFALDERLGSAADIDTGARLGLNHPMGPLELADLIGLDTVLSIAEVLQRDFGDDKYRPSPLLRNLVAAGWLGKKVGRGFYLYDATGARGDAARPEWRAA